jgi:hypothetical protein
MEFLKKLIFEYLLRTPPRSQGRKVTTPAGWHAVKHLGSAPAQAPAHWATCHGRLRFRRWDVKIPAHRAEVILQDVSDGEIVGTIVKDERCKKPSK